MNSSAIGLILGVGFFYFVLTVLMPAVIFYRFVKDRPFVVRFAFYQVTGNIYVLLIGFLFSFLNIWSPALLIILMIALPLLLKLFIGRPDLIGLVLNYYSDKSEKIVTTAGALRNIRLFLQRKLKEAFHRYIRYHYLEILLLFALFVFAVWYYGYFKMHYFTYASSDEATHLYWVNALFAGHPFPVGMYPHSMHFMIAAIHSISGIQTLVINHYFSVTIMLVLHFMIYGTVKALFRSAPAAVFATGLFLLSNMFVAQRYQNTLPMEYGMIAMLVMIVFLYEFMKRRDTLSMWVVAGATGWTFHSHFYITLFCVFIWIAFILVYLKTIIRLKAIGKTLLAVAVAIAIAVAPFGAGLAVGYRFEQSMDWALNVMGVQSDEGIISVAEQNKEMTAKEEETETNESGQQTESEQQGADAAASEEKPEKELSPYAREFVNARTPGDYVRALCHLLMAKLIRRETNARILYACLLFTFLYGVGKLIRVHLVFRKKKKKYLRGETGRKTYKKKKQELLAKEAGVLTIPFFLFFGIILCTMSYFGLPAVVEDSRAAMILAPLTALLFAAPIAFAEDLLRLIPGAKKQIPAVLLLLAVGAGLGAFYAKGPVKKLEEIGIYYVTQELSNKLSYDLIATKPKNTWTVISPVNDLLAIHYYGYHYEVIDLLHDVENCKTDIAMPTNDLYIVVDKSVLNAGGVYYLPDYHGALKKEAAPLDPEKVDLSFYDIGQPWDPPEEAYSKYRDVTMTKLYYWMEKIKKAYPNEVEVYDEDDLCVIYHVRQSADFPINLCRDYRTTNKGVKSRDDFERRYREEHGINEEQ